MQNFNLLRELGKVRKPVLLKRGIAATFEELLCSAEYVLAGCLLYTSRQHFWTGR